LRRKNTLLSARRFRYHERRASEKQVEKQVVRVMWNQHRIICNSRILATMLLGLVVGLPTRAGAVIIKGPHLQALQTDGITVVWEQENAGPGTVTIDGVVYSSPGSQTIHEVTVTGLTPDTTYSYTVDSDGVTDSGTFTTAQSDPLACFEFLAVGDNRSIHENHTMVVATLVSETNARFLMNTGDMVSSGEVAADWQFFFDIEYPLIKDMPWYPTIGNHEEDSGTLPVFYTDYLAPPTDTSGTENYYSFVYANSAFIVLDGHVDVALLGGFSATQMTWLNAELAQYSSDPAVQHIFVFTHEPPYSSKDGRWGSFQLRELLRETSDIFAIHGVDAVITGHDHYLERGESPAGIRYFIMGGGGAPLYANESEGDLGYKGPTLEGLFTDAHTVHYAQSIHGYMRVTVCNGQVDAEVVGITDITNPSGPTVTVMDTTSWNTGDITPGPDGGVEDAGVPDGSTPQPDAAATSDAAPGTDAASGADGSSPGPDGSTPGPDASTPPPAANDDGCGCRQTGGEAPGLALGLGLLLLGWLWRRRDCTR
jgi:MYXO-CTERM domain-containing protein